MSIVRLAHARSGRRGGRGRRALGDTTVTLSPVDQLALQVNRFGPGAPAAYQFHTTAFATGNPLDLDLASTAMLIYQRRAIDAYAKFADPASSALIANANAGMADPVAWVSAHLADVTGVVKSYGDSVGLPGVSGGSITDTLTASGPLGLPVGAWIAGGVAALAYLTTRKGRR